MLIATIASLLLVSADPAPATPTVETPAPEAAKSAKDGKERMVCKREAKANSRFTTKVCMTVSEWEAQTETARQAFADTQQRPMVNIGKGGLALGYAAETARIEL